MPHDRTKGEQMKIYTNQEEVNADLDKYGNLILDCSVEFTFNVVINGYIKARDIKAGDIKAGNIEACDIKAGNIDARDIIAGDIKAGNISFHAFCCSYASIKCKSWTSRREKHHAPVCLDGELIVEQKDGAK